MAFEGPKSSFGRRLSGVALAVSLLHGCGLSGEDCYTSCLPDSVSGFPRVEREPGTGRVVSTLHVGEVVNVCIFTDCNCVPIYSADWRSSDPSVASIALSPAPLTVCNDAFESARSDGADRPAELRGLRPGETQISVVVSGAEVPRDSLPVVHCPNRHNCVSIDVVRVIP